MQATSSSRTKHALIKKVFGEQPNTNKPIATLDKNVIVPASSAISHKYTFILEALLDTNKDFTVADYTGTRGLFAYLLAQDFDNSTCYIITKNKQQLASHQQIQQTFEIKNLTTKSSSLNTTKLATDITVHDITTLALLTTTSPEALAQRVAATTTKYAIIDIPSNKDAEITKLFKADLKLAQSFFSHLLTHFWIITFVPIIYTEDTIRACYLLEKRG